MASPARRPPHASGSGLSQRRRSAQVEGSAVYLAKRNELLQIAGDVFKEKGFEAATLNDIAARFGTDRAAIYYYFASKEELFQEVFQATAKRVLDDNLTEAAAIAALDTTAQEKLRRLIELLITSYEENYPYVYVYIQEDMAKVTFQSTPSAKEMVRKTRKLDRIVIGVIESGIKNGELRGDLSVPLVLNALFGMVNWTHRWFKPGEGKYTARETIDTFSAIFFDGLRKSS